MSSAANFGHMSAFILRYCSDIYSVSHASMLPGAALLSPRYVNKFIMAALYSRNARRRFIEARERHLSTCRRLVIEGVVINFFTLRAFF